MSTRGRGRTRNVPSNTQTNNDHCDVCTYGGRMMCCDGCPKAFHFTCLVPPLDVDNPPTGNWFCRECSAESTRQSQQRGRKGRRKGSLFKELKDKAHMSNPTSFMLPENIRTTFDGVFAGKHGEFRDANKEKPVQLDKRGYPVEPDRERFIDAKGRNIYCYYCKLPPRHLRPIMSCDFCDQHWHFDCLTPPLTIAPPLHKKWMCPLHADHVLPPMRRLRGEDVLPYMDNTAIEHLPEKRRIECDPEFYLNDTLHKLPKQSVKLDWIGQMKMAMKGKNEEMLQMGKNEEMLQLMAAAERILPSKKEGKKPEVQKGKGKESFQDDEVLIHEKDKGKDAVSSKGKGKEFVPIWNMNRLENDFTSVILSALLPPTTSSSTANELLDENVQMAMAIELSRKKSRKKSRVEYDDKDDEIEDEGAGPSGSNGESYEDERVAKRLRPEDYESSTSSSSSTNIRVYTENVRNRVGRDDNEKVKGGPKGPRVEEQASLQYNENDNTEIKNMAEGNPLFLLVEAAFGGFVSI
ncbi:hypothetical protein C1645_812489 [Glomus cerebriforme]|uniref:PHD-type domain-containing protein n=1 Tax=Glomus cerebriforme TaxID=658196 RepID=A0A397TMI8_9GLOM|nr:hypothetical protein C1645_812489 [Glomus cerebriforme]